jgi:pimeloyl-ACP methyl ester carboxylesterase
MKKIFFVNGIKNGVGEATQATNYLMRVLNGGIELIYNPTDSLLCDGWEAFRGRWFYRFMSTGITKKVHERIMAALNAPNCEQVVLIGHSQGTVIIANAVRLIPEHLRHRIHCILFAPVNTQEPPGGYVEYFLNDADLVVKSLPGRYMRKAWVGFKGIFKSQHKRGPVFRRDGYGHSLITSYLNHRFSFKKYSKSYFAFLERGSNESKPFS